MLCSCLSDCQGAKRYFKARTFANNVPLIAFQTAQKQPGCRYGLILPFRTFAAEKQQSVQNGSWCSVRIQTQVGNSGAPGGLPPYSGLLESRQSYRVTSLGLLFYIHYRFCYSHISCLGLQLSVQRLGPYRQNSADNHPSDLQRCHVSHLQGPFLPDNTAMACFLSHTSDPSTNWSDTEVLQETLKWVLLQVGRMTFIFRGYDFLKWIYLLMLSVRF